MKQKTLLYMIIPAIILLLAGIIWRNVLFALLGGYLIGFTNCLFMLKVEPKLKKVI